MVYQVRRGENFWYLQLLYDKHAETLEKPNYWQMILKGEQWEYKVLFEFKTNV